VNQDSAAQLRRRAPIAIVRLDDLSEALAIGRALTDGGITALEYTLTNPEALDAIMRVRAELGEAVLVGAGTVLDAPGARNAIAAGAQFLVSPTLEPAVIACGREQDVPVICGAMTPSEILTAHRLGADLVKVFPARTLGPAYIKDVLAPLPALRLVPTGGIELDNCRAFLDAGAYTVGLGSALIDPHLVATADWPALTALSRRYVQACSRAD